MAACAVEMGCKQDMRHQPVLYLTNVFVCMRNTSGYICNPDSSKEQDAASGKTLWRTYPA